MTKRRRQIGWATLGGACLTVLLIWLLWFGPFANSEVRQANSLVDAMANGRGPSLLSHFSELELECSKPTAGQLAWLASDSFSKRIAESTRLHSDIRTSDSGASGTQWYLHSSGQRWGLTVITSRTAKGPQSQAILPILMARWATLPDGSPTTGITTRMISDGIDRDFDELKANGFERILINPRGCMTLEEYRAFVRKALVHNPN